MKVSDLLNHLPPFGDKEKSVSDVLIAFGSWISYNSEAKNYLNDEEIGELDRIIREILKAYEFFQTGQISECFKIINDLIFLNTYSHQIFSSITIEIDSFFYRMRQSESAYLFSKEELFHIPFDQRQNTSNQRFSLSGYPCLYLGKSIYNCWEELKRPKFDYANIVGIKTLRPIHLLDLRINREIKEVADFYRIPLIIASAVKVQEPNLPFKPEYIISQAILHSIISYNNKSYSPENLNGILYYSTLVNSNQRLFDDLELFENVVLPTVNNLNLPEAEKIYQNGFCPVLCNTFEITDPVSLNTYQLRKDMKSTFVYGEFKNVKPYNITQMALLEEYINRSITHKILPNDFFRSRPDLLQQY